MSDSNIFSFPPSGTRDFYPQEKRQLDWLFGKWRAVSQAYGFEPYDAPVVEHEQLWKIKSGGDDVMQEMYRLQSHSETDNPLVLRPEMTPSLARMMLNVVDKIMLPAKWYSFPQCWRYENTSRGRKREHFQWNADIFGAEPVKSEYEVLAMIVEFFTSVGITSNDVVLRVSNRMILQDLLESMGVFEDRFPLACNLIDKVNKMTREELTAALLERVGLNDEQVATIYQLIEIKDVSQLEGLLPKSEAPAYMKRLFDLCESCGIGSWLQFDASIVRGLSYYTGVVFEGFFKNSTLQRAVCGGGRYDKLLSTFGAKEPVPAVGFGFGDVVITEGLQELKLFPACEQDLHAVVIPFNDDFYPQADTVARILRKQGLAVETYMKSGRIKNAYSYAGRRGAKFAILVAPEEYANGQVVVKDLRLPDDDPKKQVVVNIADL